MEYHKTEKTVGVEIYLSKEKHIIAYLKLKKDVAGAWIKAYTEAVKNENNPRPLSGK